MKKFLLVLVALGVAGAIGYLVFSRVRGASEGGAEPEGDLPPEMASDEPAGSGADC